MITSNPPLIIPLIPLLALFRNITYSILVYDVYPEAIERRGLFTRKNLLAKLWRTLNTNAMLRAKRVYTIAPCMKATLASNFKGREKPNIEVYPTWANTRQCRDRPSALNPLREKLRLSNQFVVSYAGNLSASQDLGLIVRVADRLRHNLAISFVFIGDGESLPMLQAMAADLSLANIHFLPRQPATELPNVLNLGDCTFVIIGPKFAGVSMPSKLASALAAGTPVLAVTPEKTFLDGIVRTYRCGCVIQPGDVQQTAEAVLRLHQNPTLRASMSVNAKRAAMENFSNAIVPHALATSILNDMSGLVTPCQKVEPRKATLSIFKKISSSLFQDRKS